MNKSISFLISLMFLFALVLMSPYPCAAQDSTPSPPDKALSSKMLQFGKEAYQRGKYLDAKEYFRKAIKADPSSMEAWVFYDQSVIFALAEKVEKKANLVLPDSSTRKETTSLGTPPPAEPAPAEKKVQFKIVEDEGC